MMTKKKRTMVLILVIIFIILILASIFVLLYLKTDMFKSSKTLFVKYLGQNIESFKDIENVINYDEKTNIYNETIEAKVNYTEKIGTTGENTENSIQESKLPLELIVYGNTPVMKMNYCVLGVSNKCYPECKMRCGTTNKYYLRDRLGFEFRILPDNVQTVTTIFNSKITCITNVETKITSLRIDLLDESVNEINAIAEAAIKGKKLEGKQYTFGNLNRDV